MPFNQAVPGTVIRADHYNENLSRTVGTDEARTIVVQHTFNPSSAGAPFLLGTNAQGQLVTGMNADLLDGQHASAFAAANHTHDAGAIASGTLGVARGGTGISSYAAGDLIYASGSTTLARRAIGSANQVLAVVSGVPNWQTPSGGGQVVGTGRKINVGVGLQGGGDLSADRTLSVKPADFITVSTNAPSGTPAAGVGALWAQVA